MPTYVRILQAKQFISRAVEHAKTRLHMLPIKVRPIIPGEDIYVIEDKLCTSSLSSIFILFGL